MSTLNKAISPEPSMIELLRRNLTNSEKWWRLFIWLMMVGITIIMILPLVWLVSTSLKLEQRVFQFPPEWIPNPIQLINYYENS